MPPMVKGSAPAAAAGEADLDLLGNAGLVQRVRVGVNEEPDVDERRGGRGGHHAIGHAVLGVVDQARSHAAGDCQLSGAVGRQGLALHAQRSGQKSAEPAAARRGQQMLTV